MKHTDQSFRPLIDEDEEVGDRQLSITTKIQKSEEEEEEETFNLVPLSTIATEEVATPATHSLSPEERQTRHSPPCIFSFLTGLFCHPSLHHYWLCALLYSILSQIIVLICAFHPVTVCTAQPMQLRISLTGYVFFGHILVHQGVFNECMLQTLAHRMTPFIYKMHAALRCMILGMWCLWTPLQIASMAVDNRQCTNTWLFYTAGAQSVFWVVVLLIMLYKRMS